MLQFFAIHINLIGLLPRKELKMKKEVMNKEVKNKPVNEVKKLGADKVIAINFKADDID